MTAQTARNERATLPHDSNSVVGIAQLRDARPIAQAYRDESLVAQLVRSAILESGLGVKIPDNPLADIIQPGMTVLLKPNWVLHYNQSDSGMECMITQPEFILAALSEVVRAKPGRILLGDAPIQGCDLGQILTDEWRGRFSDAAGSIPLDFIDFRRTVLRNDDLTAGVQTDARSVDRYAMFDLGSDSMLEPISSPTGRFRVTMYDPRALARTHAPGKHQYLIAREALEADVVLSLPKLKTHRKAGITGALKNLVGINGNKDYLPHHRVGGSVNGGDCYPGGNLFKRGAEWLLDAANYRIGKPEQIYLRHAAYWLNGVQASLYDTSIDLEGGWWGNDTTWRMVLDLNRILLYGTADGHMREERQRTLWSLTDAIVCGQAEGPLAPEPLWVGAVTFSGSAPAAEVAHCALLRLNPAKISLVREAFRVERWPLANGSEDVSIRCDGRSLRPDELASRNGTSTEPPRGWRGHVEWNPGGRCDDGFEYEPTPRNEARADG